MGNTVHLFRFEHELLIAMDSQRVREIFERSGLSVTDCVDDSAYAFEEAGDLWDYEWESCDLSYKEQDLLSVDFSRAHFTERAFPLLADLIVHLQACLVPSWCGEVFVPKDFDWQTHLPDEFKEWTIHLIGEAADFQEIL